ncbi:MAG: hypothetical protein GOU97_02425, partial [Nanoarchaeota archaeon]|nr:hypothetical protein [Nanoarchaeota archaeon]
MNNKRVLILALIFLSFPFLFQPVLAWSWTDWFSSVAETVVDSISFVVETVVQAVSAAVEAVTNVVIAVVETVSNALNPEPGESESPPPHLTEP